MEEQRDDVACWPTSQKSRTESLSERGMIWLQSSRIKTVN